MLKVNILHNIYSSWSWLGFDYSSLHFQNIKPRSQHYLELLFYLATLNDGTSFNFQCGMFPDPAPTSKFAQMPMEQKIWSYPSYIIWQASSGFQCVTTYRLAGIPRVHPILHIFLRMPSVDSQLHLQYLRMERISLRLLNLDSLSRRFSGSRVKLENALSNRLLRLLLSTMRLIIPSKTFKTLFSDFPTPESYSSLAFSPAAFIDTKDLKSRFRGRASEEESANEERPRRRNLLERKREVYVIDEQLRNLAIGRKQQFD